MGLKGSVAIGERVSLAVQKFKMARHLVRTVGEHSFRYERNQGSIARPSTPTNRT